MRTIYFQKISFFFGMCAAMGCQGGISGTVSGRPLDFAQAAFVVTQISDPNTQSTQVVTELYLTNRVTTCQDLGSNILRENEELLFIQLSDLGQKPGEKAPALGTYAINAPENVSLAGFADVLLLDSDCQYTPASHLEAQGGTITLSRYVLAEQIEANFDLQFSSGHLAGSVPALWCAGVSSLFTPEEAGGQTTGASCLP